MPPIRRAPVSLVVLAGEDRRATRALLERVQPALVAGDQVVCVGGGQRADAAGSWRERRANGHLERCALVPRLRDLVVLLDDRVQLSDGILEVLVDASQDVTLGVVAAMSNVATGDELCIGIPYGPDDLAARRVLLRDIAQRAAPLCEQVAQLGGPCMLLRRCVLERLGGLGALEGDLSFEELIDAAGALGLELARAPRAYVHHPGGALRLAPNYGATRPLVSACLIVKDEAHQLATCLGSMAQVADEVVIYDTGSSDGSPELARSLGASVFEGYWDDDFARARNEALAHCRGQWILWLDADEVLECGDRPGLRDELEALPSSVEGLLIAIDNLRGSEASTMTTHAAVRLFRRACGRWDGRLHEQIVPIARAGESALVRFDRARITHRGYLYSALRERDKVARNLRSAFGDLAGGSELDRGTRILSLGRSYLLAGRLEEGSELCRIAADNAQHPTARRLALRSLAEGLSALERYDEALEVIAELRAQSAIATEADILEGRTLLAMGEHERALSCLCRVGHVIDEDSFEYAPSTVAADRATSLQALRRPSEAADVLLASLRESRGLDSHLGMLIENLEAAKRSPGEIIDCLEPTRLLAFVPQLLQLQPGAADRVLESWYERAPGAVPVLAAAATVAVELAVERQLVWSARLREAGQRLSCPLVAASIAPSRSTESRVLAAAVCWTSFRDERALLGFGPSVLDTPVSARPALRSALSQLAPDLLARFDELCAHGRAASAPPVAKSPCGEAVLVLAAHGLDLGATATAIAHANAGDATTMIAPSPTEELEQLLAPLRVTVLGYDADPDEATRRRFLLQAVVRHYATERVQRVMATGDATLADSLGEMLPVSLVESRPDHDHDLGALLTALAGPEPLEDGARTGILVIDTTASEEHDARAALLEESLRAVLDDGRPLAVLSGSSTARVRAQRTQWPNVSWLGARANPRPWIACASVIVLIGEDVAPFVELARISATPAVVVTDDKGAHDLASRLATAAIPRPIARPERAGLRSGPARTTPPAPARRRLARVRPLVCLSSPLTSLDSLAQVNRELARRLGDGTVPFDLVVTTPEPSAATPEAASALEGIDVRYGSRAVAADLEIRHQWPPDFRPSRSSQLVCIQPFEFGGLPAEWVGPLRDVVEELWVPSTFVGSCAIESGVSPEMISVVPNGVDTALFCPDGARYPLSTTKGTRLLFVGGCIARKGIDALLEAYLSCFDQEDDICLVVKPYGASGVYRNANLEADVRRAAAGRGAAIEIVEGDLSTAELAALYRSCDALVHPYRGEGFGLTVAEAMACGLPVVVSDGGACRDFCDDEVAWLVPTRMTPLGAVEWTTTKAGAWWLEPSRLGLAAAMRGVLEAPELARRRGEAGARRIAERFTWDMAARRAGERIEALLERERRLVLAGASQGPVQP